MTVAQTPHLNSAPTGDDVQVIAKASKTIIVLTAVLAIPSLWTAVQSPSILAWIWLAGHIAIVVRVAQLRLSVSKAGVIIQNFFRTTTVPVWEAEIEVRVEKETVLLSDSGGRLDTEGRVLYIRRPWNQEAPIHVGIAPRFGREFDRIHDELVDAIATQRAA